VETPDFALYQAQRDMFGESLASFAKETFLCRSIPHSARIFVALCHAVEVYKDRFDVEPTLLLMADALTNHASLVSLRNTNTLKCKLCINSPPSSAPAKPIPSYSILNMIMHFQLSHESMLPLMADLAAGRSLSFLHSVIALPTRAELEPLVIARNITTTSTMKLYQDALQHFAEPAKFTKTRGGHCARAKSPPRRMQEPEARARSRSPVGMRADQSEDTTSHYRQRDDAPISRSITPRVVYVDDEGYEYVRISSTPYVGHPPRSR
jgi:hypothetical protein